MLQGPGLHSHCYPGKSNMLPLIHCNDIIAGAMASQITSLTILYSAVCSGADQRKHQIPMSLAFGQGIHRWPVNSPHKWPVTQKMFPFDNVIMLTGATGSTKTRHSSIGYFTMYVCHGSRDWLTMIYFTRYPNWTEISLNSYSNSYEGISTEPWAQDV